MKTKARPKITPKRPLRFTVGPPPITGDAIAAALLDTPAQRAAFLEAETREAVEKDYAFPPLTDPLFAKTPISPLEKVAWAEYSRHRRQSAEKARLNTQRLQQDLDRWEKERAARKKSSLFARQMASNGQSSQLGQKYLSPGSQQRPNASGTLDPKGAPYARPNRRIQDLYGVNGMTAALPTPKGGRHPGESSDRAASTMTYEERYARKPEEGSRRGADDGGIRDRGTIHHRGAGAASPPGTGPGRVRGRKVRKLAIAHVLALPAASLDRNNRCALRLHALGHTARHLGIPMSYALQLERTELERIVASLPRRGHPVAASLRVWLRRAPVSRWAFPRLDGPDAPASRCTAVWRVARRRGWMVEVP